MNRRQMIMLPGAALLAHQGFAQIAQISAPSSAPASQKVSRKVLLRLSQPKGISKIPKTDTKTTKYLNSLNTLLSLSPAQQQQAATIFAAAVTAGAPLRSNRKAARQSLNTAITNNDSRGINEASAALGRATAQLTASGASAYAAFYQILTADQQSKLAQVSKLTQLNS